MCNVEDSGFRADRNHEYVRIHKSQKAPDVEPEQNFHFKIFTLFEVFGKGNNSFQICKPKTLNPKVPNSKP